jgi:hypothetical protein
MDRESAAMNQSLIRSLSKVLVIGLCAAGRVEAFAVAPATPISGPNAAALPPELAALLWIPLLLTVAVLGFALVWALRARRTPRQIHKRQPVTPRRYRRLPEPVGIRRTKKPRSRGITASGMA